MPDKKSQPDQQKKDKDSVDKHDQKNTTQDHEAKKVNKNKSKNETDLAVKNEVTGANLDAPPG